VFAEEPQNFYVFAIDRLWTFAEETQKPQNFFPQTLSSLNNMIFTNVKLF